MTLPFSTNTLIISLLCLGIFSPCPLLFFRGQGKIKVGTGELLSHRRVRHGIMTHKAWSKHSQAAKFFCSSIITFTVLVINE